MASATIERLVAHFDRREQRTVPPLAPKESSVERAAWREQIVNALERLEANGVLDQRDSLENPLTESLVTVAEGTLWEPFAREPGRTRIFGELVFNLADPKRINQGLKGTCGAACIEGYMAERDPAEYARIVTGLVTRDGRATLKSGEELVCDEDVLGPGPLEQGRNPVSRVFQAACMEFAYPNMDYDNVVDGHFDGDENVGSGLEMNAFERLLAAVTGETWKTISVAHTRMASMFSRLGMDTHDVVDIVRDGLSIIDQSTRQGDHVFVTLQLPSVPNPIPGAEPAVLHDAPHKVRVLRIDWTNRSIHYDDPMDPTQSWFDGAEVTIHDAQGHCSMKIDDFLRLMTELSYRPALWKRSV
ncbi:MAG: hypothetical protein IPM54_10950 [Polyangiaceae bacterium]|nr:hypothetical protein [Polyangiaceae bacterium]